MSPLGLLSRGDVAEIVTLRHKRVDKEGAHASSSFERCSGGGFRFRSRHRGSEKRLADLGFSPGQVIEVVENSPAMPMLLKICDSRIAIDRGIAMRIMVRRIAS